MKPPRSVWVVTNGYGVVCKATHDEDYAGRWRKAVDAVTHYILPPKRKARKGDGRGK